ncbi:MAG: hypothetical protein II129_06370, partial [Paludibacteraceae bacterium]|nr:hypothetical protein [Paludibacteraceae bacterium]
MVYREIPTAGYTTLKTMALAFVDRMKVGEEPGAYRKEASETGPSTYGAYHAAIIYSLFDELAGFSSGDIDRWAQRINMLQCANGYYSNRKEDQNRARG